MTTTKITKKQQQQRQKLNYRKTGESRQLNKQKETINQDKNSEEL